MLGIAYLAFRWAFPSGYELAIDRPFHGTLRFGDIKCGSQGDTCRALVAAGTLVELAYDAEEGYVLKNYTGGCAPAGTVQMNEPRRCGAVFELGEGPPPPPPTSTLTIVPPQGGRMGGANGLDCGGARTNCVTTIPAGQLVTLFQYADVGYSFDGFTGDCSKLDGTTTMTTDRSCGASFKPGITTTTTTFIPPEGGIKKGVVAQGRGGIRVGACLVDLPAWTRALVGPSRIIRRSVAALELDR